MADDNGLLIEGTRHKKYRGEILEKLALAEKQLRTQIQAGFTGSTAHLSEALAAVSASRQLVESMDPTDSKTAEELRASEANMAAAQRIARFGSWELDLEFADRDKNPLRWSDGLFHIMGLVPGEVEVSNDLFFQFVPPEDHEPIRQAVDSAIRNRSGYSIIHRLMRPDGELRIIQERAECVLDPRDNNVIKLIGTAHDITETRQAEEKLRKSDEWFRCVFNQRFQFMAILSATGEVMAINDLPLRVGGTTREDVLGKVFWETIWWEKLPDVKAAWPGRLEAADQSSDPVFSEDTFMTSSGELRIAEVSIESVKKSDGGVDFFIVQASDVTERRRAEDELRNSEEQSRTLAEAIPQLLWTVLPNGNLTYVNQKWIDYTGISFEESLGFGWMAALHPEELGSIMERWDQAFQSGETYETEYRLKNADGTYHWLLGRALPLRDQTGSIVKWLGTSTDIHALKLSEEAIRRSEINLANSQRIAHLGSWVWELDSGERRWSDEVYRLFGVPPSEAPDPSIAFQKGIHPDDLLAVNAALDASLTKGEEEFNIQHRVVRPDGSVIHVHNQGELEYGEDGRPLRMTGTILDITARKLAEEQLIHDALHDSLTGLANRTLLADHIGIAFNRFLRTGEEFALLLIDLDRFKNINDTLGHPVGDQVLMETAKRFLSIARISDTVARLGGDEFAILLEDTTLEDSVTRIAQRLLDVMNNPFNINGAAVEIGASMGVVVVTPNYTSTDEIFRDADIALYRAKDAGRGVYQLFDKEMHIRIRERMEVETDLRHAIKREEMSLYLQPIISLKTGTILSFEALLRWKHSRRGFIPPDVFISVAEETGLISSIGQWVAREACRTLRNWPGNHVPSISINVSPCEIVPRSCVGSPVPEVEDIDSTITRIAEEENINPELLRIEITEGVFINDPIKAAKVMDRLVENGFNLLLDDFGTGYSSLSYLQDLPFYQVKLDRAFTAKLEPGNRSNGLMRGIVTLAHNIGLEIVAEGVETEEQLTLVRAAGCDFAQGFFFSRPLPVEEAYLLHQTGRQW